MGLSERGAGGNAGPMIRRRLESAEELRECDADFGDED